MRNQKGVTLFEVVGCLLILGILSSIAVPASQAMMVRYKFSTETARLEDALKIAKSYAITKKAPVVFSYNHDGYMVYIDDGAGGGMAGDWTRQPGERLLVNCNLREAGLLIDVTQSTFSAKRTKFSGSPAIKAGSVVLVGADGAKAKIVVNIIGRVRTERLI